MFDDLLDPLPPKAGMREFALVTTRARAIRRRRHALATAPLIVAAVVLAPILVSRYTNNTQVILGPGNETTSTTELPGTYRLKDVESITELPLLDLGGRELSFAIDRAAGLITQGSDGSVCVVFSDDTNPKSCAPAGSRLHVAQWNDPAGNPDRMRLVIFLVASEVKVALATAGTSCTSVLPATAPVTAWACPNIDPATTTINVLNGEHILIDTVS